MSQTDTKYCLSARNDKSSHGGSRGTHRGDRNGNRGNSRFANSLLVGELTNNRISHLSITKDRPQSNQLSKILGAIKYLCQDKHYDYISDIISANTGPTQEYFLSDHSIKRQRLSKHHAKIGVIDHIIWLEMTPGNSPINSETAEDTPISNLYPQVHHHSDHN